MTVILFATLSIYFETDLNGMSLGYERISFMAVISTNTDEESSGKHVSTARLWPKLITPGYAKERSERHFAINGRFGVAIGFLDDLQVICERNPKRVDFPWQAIPSLWKSLLPHANFRFLHSPQWYLRSLWKWGDGWD